MALLIVQVNVRVKPEFLDAFRQATLANAAESVKEPGIARFDVLQSQDDPSQFVLVEAYRSERAPADHKLTAHYQAWKETVSGMMAEPRLSKKFKNLYPDDPGWG